MRRLFPNYGEVEKDYYRRTKIYPIMHTVVIRRDIYERDPWVALSLYKALCRAKDYSYHMLADAGSPKASLAWLQPLLEEEQAIIGPDWYPYGIEQNRPTIEALLQYTHEQGLTGRRIKLEELFAPSHDARHPAQRRATGLTPIASAGADDRDQEAERQIDRDDLPDAVEIGACCRPVSRIDRALELEPRPVEQPEKQRDHHPADALHQVNVHADAFETAERVEHHPIAAAEQQQDRDPHPGKEFLKRPPHQLESLRRFERSERRAQAHIEHEHPADPDDGTENMQSKRKCGHDMLSNGRKPNSLLLRFGKKRQEDDLGLAGR